MNDIYNRCISFFEIMTGRNKFALSNLDLEQLRKWWHEVYALVGDGPIIGHHLDDVSTYVTIMEKYQDIKVEWDVVVRKLREEIKSMERKFKVLITPPLADLYLIFLMVQDKLN